MRIFENTFDSVTGVQTIIGAEDGKMVVKTLQDVAPHLDHTKRLRDNHDYAKQGIKSCFMHAVHIPDSVAMKMRTEDGFDVYTATAKEVRQFLAKNRIKYAYLFVTEGRI
jgi:hypothetical protein